MGKFAELCKGRTMGAFFLLLLTARTMAVQVSLSLLLLLLAWGVLRISIPRDLALWQRLREGGDAFGGDFRAGEVQFLQVAHAG